MNNVNKLHQVCQETTNSLFKLSVEANSPNWTLYIYYSQILFRGSFDEVVEDAINEFLDNRIEPLTDASKNFVSKYRYLKKPNGSIHQLKKADQKGRTIFRTNSSSKKDAYTLKLEFANSLGYSNFTECFSNLGHHNFNNQFKAWQQKEKSY